MSTSTKRGTQEALESGTDKYLRQVDTREVFGKVNKLRLRNKRRERFGLQPLAAWRDPYTPRPGCNCEDPIVIEDPDDSFPGPFPDVSHFELGETFENPIVISEEEEEEEEKEEGEKEEECGTKSDAVQDFYEEVSDEELWEVVDSYEKKEKEGRVKECGTPDNEHCSSVVPDMDPELCDPECEYVSVVKK